MKWKRLAAELVPEKTFLIIRDDLKSLEAKENSFGRAKPRSALDTGTWPPKLKYNHHPNNRRNRSSVGRERPKTANLERPSVLDPRLLNKLDMSLVRKELLRDSMTRIRRSAKSRVGGGTTGNPASGGSRRRQSVPVAENSCALVSVSSGERASNALTEEDKPRRGNERGALSLPIVAKKSSSLEQSSDRSSGMKKQSSGRREDASSGESPGSYAKRRISEGKRLDDNNNNNNNKKSDTSSNDASLSKVSPLTSVRRSKTSKIAVSTEIDVFTGATSRGAPEPCKTCGRPDQPERFHSHPKSLSLPPRKDKDSGPNGKSRAAVPKTVQKPVALNFRSEKSKRAGESSASVSHDSKDEANQRAPRNPSRRGPKTVTCYVCAREFGSASFPIHEPKCMQKWERENNSLPASQRRPVPQRPVVPLDHSDWNAAAWEQSQAQLVPCWKCGRTFLPERLEVHERSCKCIRKIESSAKSTASEKPEKSVERVSHPATVHATVLCQICKRNFGTRSIKIHEPQCSKKWQAENDLPPYNEAKKKTLTRVERSADAASRNSSLTTSPARLSSHRKPTATCYICGRDFGSASIEIHEPQCLRKWQNENSKLPTHQQRDEPRKPDPILTSESSSENSSDVWAATNEARWKSHLGQLVPCKHCKRTFNPDRVNVHERSCKGIR